LTVRSGIGVGAEARASFSPLIESDVSSRSRTLRGERSPPLAASNRSLKTARAWNYPSILAKFVSAELRLDF